MITFQHRGSFKNTEKFLTRVRGAKYITLLNKYGREGVNALSAATPTDTGKTSSSWAYKIEDQPNSTRIFWYNTNTNDNVNIALILQYGHGTANGGFVRGRDYINPAMRPIFDKMANEVWKEVTSV